MSLRYYDAHNHLQDERLAVLLEALPMSGTVRSVVAGSGQEDWPQVAALAQCYPWVLPCFGVHPWQVKGQIESWAAELENYLMSYPEAAVGEVGLDRWVPEPDVPLQLAMLHTQLRLAQKLERPVVLHCLRAFGLLLETLETTPRLPRGFLLHSYGGPLEMLPSFTKLGAYYSVSPYFLHERKARQWQTFAAVPLDRLLVETDAPDMWPPAELNPHPLQDAEGKPMNHPANVALVYEHLAKLRGMPVEVLSSVVEQNFLRLYC